MVNAHVTEKVARHSSIYLSSPAGRNHGTVFCSRWPTREGNRERREGERESRGSLQTAIRNRCMHGRSYGICHTRPYSAYYSNAPWLSVPGYTAALLQTAFPPSRHWPLCEAGLKVGRCIRPVGEWLVMRKLGPLKSCACAQRTILVTM